MTQDCLNMPQSSTFTHLLPIPTIIRLPQWLSSKESTFNEGDAGLIPGLGRSLEEGNGNLLQYSCLENSMDRGAWEATVQGVSKRQTQLSDQHTHMVRVYLVCETSPNYLPK